MSKKPDPLLFACLIMTLTATLEWSRDRWKAHAPIWAGGGDAKRLCARCGSGQITEQP